MNRLKKALEGERVRKLLLDAFEKAKRQKAERATESTAERIRRISNAAAKERVAIASAPPADSSPPAGDAPPQDSSEPPEPGSDG